MNIHPPVMPYLMVLNLGCFNACTDACYLIAVELPPPFDLAVVVGCIVGCKVACSGDAWSN